MAALENVDRISFTVETLMVREGKKLGLPRPDKDGYFCDFPMAALGVATRNDTYYEVPEFVNQITSKDTYVNKMLVDGTLYGEYDHPDVVGLPLEMQLNRLAVVRPDRISHHFKKISTGPKLEGGGVLLVADIKPSGVMGAHLKANLEEPLMNTAFSLRSITQDKVVGTLRRRKMRKLVTFDAVAAGGYEQASKRFAATEGLEVAFNPAHAQAVFTEVALESFTNSELNDIFGTKNLAIHRREVTLLKGTGLLSAGGERGRMSLYHELVKAN